ncbi:MAG: hypothetical protein NVS3B26_24420 [Mycobacteriales bacterium]
MKRSSGLLGTRPHGSEVAVALVVALVGVQEVVAPVSGFAHRAGPAGAPAGSYLPASAALLWRRVAPPVVAAVVTAVSALPALPFGSPGLRARAGNRPAA